jgi:hypothetical protein
MSVKLTLRSYLPWRGLNPTVRMICFHPVGLFEPLTPLVPLSPWPAAWGEGARGWDEGVGAQGRSMLRPYCAPTAGGRGFLFGMALLRNVNYIINRPSDQKGTGQ